jgi:hypothetical protein
VHQDVELQVVPDVVLVALLETQLKPGAHKLVLLQGTAPASGTQQHIGHSQ